MTIPPAQITDQARQYALVELCRRAGFSDDTWRRWRVEQRPGELVLRRAEVPGEVVFPAAKAELRSELVVRKACLGRPPNTSNGSASTPATDFVVPFCNAASVDGEPLFQQTSSAEFRCTEDLLASTVLVLSRFEEIDAPHHDEHGRFRSADSVAARDGYLDRPIVDEWGLALEQVMAALEPGFHADRKLRVKISHDVDLIGIPFGLREPAVQMISRRQLGVGLRDLFSGFTGALPGSLAQVMTICEMMQARGLRSALYWKASAKTAHDSGYDIRDVRVARVMDWARSHGVEMGVHPGYFTFGDRAELQVEVERCSAAIGEREMGGRQHYLRWSPETWLHWEHCGLAYDSTVGYADCVGFRAGTCWPYQPWLWGENRPAGLLEIPLIVMEQSLISPSYMGLSPRQSAAGVKNLLRKCAAVGGVFTLLWHNNCLGHPYAAHLPAVLDMLAGLENYDWREDVSHPCGIERRWNGAP